jgi:hypothetical protein
MTDTEILESIINTLVDSEKYFVFTRDKSGAVDALETISQVLSVRTVLTELPDDDIIDYVINDLDNLVFADKEDAMFNLDLVEPNDLEMTEYGNAHSTLYRQDCIQLVKELADKKGWDFIYEQLEKFKP